VVGRQAEQNNTRKLVKKSFHSFEKDDAGDVAADQASFDLIRASINLWWPVF
jgi:hypothetical protein